MIQMFIDTNIQYKDIYKITYQGMIFIPLIYFVLKMDVMFKFTLIL